MVSLSFKGSHRPMKALFVKDGYMREMTHHWGTHTAPWELQSEDVSETMR